MAQSIGEVDENLSFLTLEVTSQVQRTQRYLQQPAEELLHKIIRRDDYIDRLRNIIQRKCFNLAAELEPSDRVGLEQLRSLDTITANLERIADFCESVVAQERHLEHPELLEIAEPSECLDEILRGLGLIVDAVADPNAAAGLEICRIEARLDEYHARTFETVLKRLDAGGDAQSLVTVLFMSHYFERMGDAMLNIGEAVLSATLGERIKLEEYMPLRSSVERLWSDLEDGDLTIEAIGETRSGCRIDRVSAAGSSGERMLVFKEGANAKLREEKESIELWNERLPGYAPRIYSFEEGPEHGALLFEHIHGLTIEDCLLSAEESDLRGAQQALFAALRDIWQKTHAPGPHAPRFVAQLRKRLGEVYRVHPEYRNDGAQLGPLRVESFDELVDRAERFDALTAPFGVLIHGDLNIDNAIYDPETRQIRFVDLHRSKVTDYVQDLSVHMVSYYRLQVFEQEVRARIHRAMQAVLEFGRTFAAEHGDETFEVRLALGLARSFATSARFVLNTEASQSLFQRARYLVEQLVEIPQGAVANYRLPGKILRD